MSLLDTLQPDFRPWAEALFDLAQRAGVKPRVTSATRSHAKQQALYDEWQKGINRYPVALPGHSAHEYGYAFDMVVPSRIDQADLGIVWRRWDGKYGGEEDPVHFEYPNWRALVGIAPVAPDPAPRSIRKVLEEAVDLALGWLPTPIRGIVNTASLASAIFELSGRSPGLLLNWLAHPQEYFDAAFSIVWSLALYNLRQAWSR